MLPAAWMAAFAAMTGRWKSTSLRSVDFPAAVNSNAA
jgi:hypothetical protein